MTATVLNEIQNVTKHKNLDSLKHYISGPTYTEKQNYNEALLKHSENDTTQDETPPKKQYNKAKSDFKTKTAKPTMGAKTPVMPQKPNIDSENCLVPVS